MFRFEASGILWLLILIIPALLWFAFLLRYKKSKLKQAGHYPTIQRLFSNWSQGKAWLKYGITVFALTAMIIAWANPQWGSRTETVKIKSSDIVIALDISQSMLAEDISPNRMERAKFMLSELLKKLRGDRVGLVFFAGSAYLQMPLSNDFASAETFIRSANPSQAGTQGTVIADAIELSQTIFGDDSPSQKALIIVSDGENHETEAVEAAQEAFDNGIYTFTLGIGTEEGANIPVIKGGKRFLKRDNEGQAVVSSLNVNNLQNIAEAGGGKFFLLNNSSSVLSQLERELERLKKKEVEQRSFTDYNSYFQYFIFMAILALSVELLLSTLKGTSDKLKSILTR